MGRYLVGHLVGYHNRQMGLFYTKTMHLVSVLVVYHILGNFVRTIFHRYPLFR